MAEVVGTIAAGFELFHCVKKALSLASDVFEKVNEGSRLLGELADRLEHMIELTHFLGKRSNRTARTDLSTQRCLQNLLRLREIVRNLRGSETDRKMGTRNVLKWKVMEKKINGLRRKVEEDMHLLILDLQVSCSPNVTSGFGLSYSVSIFSY